MISKHLPPGTKIECTEDATATARSYAKKLGGAMPEKGSVYTVRGFASDAPHCVYLAELSFPRWPFHEGLEPAFGREFFKVVQPPTLPSVLLECLNARPADKREVVEG